MLEVCVPYESLVRALQPKSDSGSDFRKDIERGWNCNLRDLFGLNKGSVVQRPIYNMLYLQTFGDVCNRNTHAQLDKLDSLKGEREPKAGAKWIAPRLSEAHHGRYSAL